MGLFGGGGDSGFAAARDANEENRALFQRIALPEYEKYNPELYDNESLNYVLNQEDPVLRSKQLEALSRMQDLSGEGLSDADRAGFAQARSMGDQIARSKTDSAINDAQVRGVAGSGQEFAMREAAGQAAAQRAQEAALQQQAAAAQQKQQYLQAYASQLGQTRDQDNRANSANTNIINQFNQANTQNRNATAANNVDARNSAFKYNEGTKDKNYNNQLGRADRIAGINTRGAEITAAQAAADEQRRRGQISAIGAVAGGAMGGVGGAAIGSQAGNLLY